jgi:hypothetical protein
MRPNPRRAARSEPLLNKSGAHGLNLHTRPRTHVAYPRQRPGRFVYGAAGCLGVAMLCALIGYLTATEEGQDSDCCRCVHHGKFCGDCDGDKIDGDPGFCSSNCHVTPDGSIVPTWIWEDYTNSMDPNYGPASVGEISDGGNDMYDGGNVLSTSLCRAKTRLGPYTTDMAVIESDCFGSGGSYRMVVERTMMVVVAPKVKGTQGDTWDFEVSGNLGADGRGEMMKWEFPLESGSQPTNWAGFSKTVCADEGRSKPDITHRPGPSGALKFP